MGISSVEAVAGQAGGRACFARDCRSARRRCSRVGVGEAALFGLARNRGRGLTGVVATGGRPASITACRGCGLFRLCDLLSAFSSPIFKPDLKARKRKEITGYFHAFGKVDKAQP